MKESKEKYKLLIIAPAGAHLKNFLARIEHAASSIHIITSKPLSFETNCDVTFVDFGLKRQTTITKPLDKSERFTNRLNPILFMYISSIR